MAGIGALVVAAPGGPAPITAASTTPAPITADVQLH